MSNIDIYALNAKGMNPLHMLASYGKDNSTAILECFKQCIPDFNLDQKDLKGNSGKHFLFKLKLIESFNN